MDLLERLAFPKRGSCSPKLHQKIDSALYWHFHQQYYLLVTLFSKSVSVLVVTTRLSVPVVHGPYNFFIHNTAVT